MHRYYHGLDAVRFFSACAVCVFHLGFYAWAAEYSSMERIFAHAATFDLLTPIAWMGWIGVQIFFVISGFVIANSANGATPFGFLRSRMLRLWPAAWVCATITLLVRMAWGEDFGRPSSTASGIARSCSGRRANGSTASTGRSPSRSCSTASSSSSC